jgi:hypothetical protein
MHAAWGRHHGIPIQLTPAQQVIKYVALSVATCAATLLLLPLHNKKHAQNTIRRDSRCVWVTPAPASPAWCIASTRCQRCKVSWTHAFHARWHMACTSSHAPMHPPCTPHAPRCPLRPWRAQLVQDSLLVQAKPADASTVTRTACADKPHTCTQRAPKHVIHSLTVAGHARCRLVPADAVHCYCLYCGMHHNIAEREHAHLALVSRDNSTASCSVSTQAQSCGTAHRARAKHEHKHPS